MAYSNTVSEVLFSTNLTELLWKLVFWALSHKRKPTKNFKGIPQYCLDRKINKLHLLLSEEKETAIYDSKHAFALIACDLLYNSDRRTQGISFI